MLFDIGDLAVNDSPMRKLIVKLVTKRICTQNFMTIRQVLQELSDAKNAL